MRMLLGLLKPLQFFNDIAGWLGRSVSAIALALMVFVILLQVFCRYVLGNALPWPDEAARFCMLWLTGLMAPVALRQGGFVAIDTLATFLPRRGVGVTFVYDALVGSGCFGAAGLEPCPVGLAVFQRLVEVAPSSDRIESDQT